MNHTLGLIEKEAMLQDAWDTCAYVRLSFSGSLKFSASKSCLGHDYSHSFHGWMGTLANRYLGRLIHYVLLAIHGNGLDLPKAVELVCHSDSSSLSRWPTYKQFKNILASLPSPAQFYENLPASLSRMHVDWILTSRNAMVKMVIIGTRQSI